MTSTEKNTCRSLIMEYINTHSLCFIPSDQFLFRFRGKLKYKVSPMDARTLKMVQFEDLLPIMAKNLGGQGLINELCNGFQLLMDVDKGVITIDSLKRNTALLGLQSFRDDEIESMITEGDMDGDGALNQLEFCILMFRLSPALMDGAERLMEEVFLQDLMP